MRKYFTEEERKKAKYQSIKRYQEKNKEKVKKWKENYRRKKGIPPRIVKYPTEEARRARKREREEKYRREKGIPKQVLYFTQEEKRKAHRISVKKYRENNLEKVKKRQKEWKEKNKEKYREKKKIQQKKYRENNKEKISMGKKKCYEKKREHYLNHNKNYRINNKEKVKECIKKSMAKNVEKYRKMKTDYILKRLKTDINFKLQYTLRNRLRSAIKGNYKAGSAVRDLGCSIPELKTYLESKWKEGMTWQNWSRTGWHIDHIIPLDFFNLQNRDEFLKACHYTNLQPLWSKENLEKGSKLDWNPQLI